MITRKRLIALAVAIMIIMMAVPIMAEGKPIQLSILNPVQMVPETEGISGVRLNLFYSRNTYVSGLDWSLFVSHTTTGMSKGAQFALVGINDADFVGFQGSLVNVNKGNFEGFQWGFVNYANHASGFQLGFVNYARTLNGLQIGLVNIIKQGGQFPVFPLINWSF